MLTLRVIPPRLLRPSAEPEPRDLTAQYFDLLWRHWSTADRAMAMALACGEAARTAFRRREAWRHGWNAGEENLFERAPDRAAHLGMAARKGMHRLINPGAYPLEANPLKNKRLFAERCAVAGLRVPACFSGAEELQDWLAGENAVIAKPNFASKGAGIAGYRRQEDGWVSGELRLTTNETVKRLRAGLAAGGLLQRMCDTHPDLAVVSPCALPTLRIMTAVNEVGAIEVCGLVIRLNGGGSRAVDNFNAGNIAAGVDRDGRIRFGLRRVGSRLERFDRHPATGARLRGVRVPDLAAAQALAVEAHEAFRDGFAVVGWDIGLSSDGPVLVEGNWNPGPDILQLVQNHGVGDGRLGEIYRFHLAQLPAETWRAARPVERDIRRAEGAELAA
ncbi:sugar-transfer associated ATP-grasp domain-containing protein [Methylopila sp. M107]|uniref:sugar-transfer associated ATP-grasp domain-containing protein n=1 Tax=Methylopila sp. M107 TaxID=1101190 RepID=UPI00036D0E4F|nr:sugar-transfer associated ATP-grasp domain-containing protein [Methylopila sp. M107]